MNDWEKDEELYSKLVMPRVEFYKSLGFVTDDELFFYCEREYAIPECIATTVVVNYFIDDESIVDDGKLEDKITFEAFATHLRDRDRELTFDNNDICTMLHHETLAKFTKTDVRRHVKEMIRGIETRLKNVFDLERVS